MALGFGSAAAAEDDEHYEDALNRWWEGEVLNVPWDGSDEYETFAGDRFTHDVIAVPGDWIHRTLAVSNNGPCPGVLTVEILNPQSTEAEDTVNHDDTSVTEGRTGFAGMSEVHWDVAGERGSSSFADLTHRQRLAEVPILKDEVVYVKLAYSFPFEETEGKHLGGTSQYLEFDIGLGLRGDYCDRPPRNPTPSYTIITHRTDSPSPSPTDNGSDGPKSPTPKPRDDLPFTGANILFGCVSAAFLLAAGVTATLGSARRRRSSQE
jgi:hypothetical protein